MKKVFYWLGFSAICAGVVMRMGDLFNISSPNRDPNAIFIVLLVGIGFLLISRGPGKD